MAHNQDGFTLVSSRKKHGKKPARTHGQALPSPTATPTSRYLDSLSAACELPDGSSHHPGLKYVSTQTASGRRAKLAVSSPSLERLIFRLDATIDKIERCTFVTTIGGCLDAFADRLGSAHEVDIVCLGLGSLRYGANPMNQLAALELLRRAVKSMVQRCHIARQSALAEVVDQNDASQDAHTEPNVSVFAYDPLFDADDVAVFARLGYHVIPENEGGRRAMRLATHGELDAQAGRSDSGIDRFVPTIFFLPHCGGDLNGAVMATNWGPQLERMLFIGNSLSWYRRCQEERAGGPAGASRDSEGTDANALQRLWQAASVCTLQNEAGSAGTPVPRANAGPALRHVLEVPLKVPHNDSEWEEAYRALDATSVHSFTWREA